MTNKLEFEIPGGDVAVIPAGTPRAIYEYVNGERTEHPRTDALGRPLFAFEALVQWEGRDLGSVRVSTPLDRLPASRFGVVLRGDGVGALTVANASSGYDLRISVLLEGLIAETSE